MKRINPAARKRFVQALTPHLLARQSFLAAFSDYRAAKVVAGKVVMNPPFTGFDDIARQFLGVVKPAVQTIRAFRRNPPSSRYRKYSSLLKSRGQALLADHTSDEFFDAAFVFNAMRDTGLRFVYSIDSRKVDLAMLFGALWNPAVLLNPATAIGATTVRHAKDMPGGDSTIRFVMHRDSIGAPDVFIYAPKDRIVELFKFATEHIQFDRFRVRDLMRNY